MTGVGPALRPGDGVTLLIGRGVRADHVVRIHEICIEQIEFDLGETRRGSPTDHRRLIDVVDGDGEGTRGIDVSESQDRSIVFAVTHLAP